MVRISLTLLPTALRGSEMENELFAGDRGTRGKGGQLAWVTPRWAWEKAEEDALPGSCPEHLRSPPSCWEHPLPTLPVMGSQTRAGHSQRSQPPGLSEISGWWAGACGQSTFKTKLWLTAKPLQKWGDEEMTLFLRTGGRRGGRRPHPGWGGQGPSFF